MSKKSSNKPVLMEFDYTDSISGLSGRVVAEWAKFKPFSLTFYVEKANVFNDVLTRFDVAERVLKRFSSLVDYEISCNVVVFICSCDSFVF